MDSFGFKLRSLRGSRAITQRELSARKGIDTGLLSRMETGEARYLPNVETIQRLIRALDLSQSEADSLYVLARRIPPDVEDKILAKPELFARIRKA